jgi:hypothetical protein
VGKNESVIELIDAIDPNEQQQQQQVGKGKHIKHQQDSNFMSRNRGGDSEYDDEEQNDSYQYYNANSEMNNENELDADDNSKVKGKLPKKSNLKKYSNRNKTLSSKYNVNKANRLADPENRLQKAKGMIIFKNIFLTSDSK